MKVINCHICRLPVCSDPQTIEDRAGITRAVGVWPDWRKNLGPMTLHASLLSKCSRERAPSGTSKATDASSWGSWGIDPVQFPRSHARRSRSCARGERLWTDDVDQALAYMSALGARPLNQPHNFIGIVRGARVAAPHGIQCRWWRDSRVPADSVGIRTGAHGRASRHQVRSPCGRTSDADSGRRPRSGRLQTSPNSGAASIDLALVARPVGRA
jgi:hypothetical protein